VHGAALPRHAEDLRQRGFQVGMRVADGELDADQAARDERAQELAPERLGLRGADVEADDLAAARLVDGVRDDDALACNTVVLGLVNPGTRALARVPWRWS
jgi:hypothetical protein